MSKKAHKSFKQNIKYGQYGALLLMLVMMSYSCRNEDQGFYRNQNMQGVNTAYSSSSGLPPTGAPRFNSDVSRQAQHAQRNQNPMGYQNAMPTMRFSTQQCERCTHQFSENSDPSLQTRECYEILYHCYRGAPIQNYQIMGNYQLGPNKSIRFAYPSEEFWNPPLARQGYVGNPRGAYVANGHIPFGSPAFRGPHSQRYRYCVDVNVDNCVVDAQSAWRASQVDNDLAMRGQGKKPQTTKPREKPVDRGVALSEDEYSWEVVAGISKDPCLNQGHGQVSVSHPCYGQGRGSSKLKSQLQGNLRTLLSGFGNAGVNMGQGLRATGENVAYGLANTGLDLASQLMGSLANFHVNAGAMPRYNLNTGRGQYNLNMGGGRYNANLGGNYNLNMGNGHYHPYAAAGYAANYHGQYGPNTDGWCDPSASGHYGYRMHCTRIQICEVYPNHPDCS